MELCAIQNAEDTLLTDVIVPKSGGVTSTKAVVVRWLKRVGDKINLGDPLVELETEKVSYELESPATGTLRKIVAGEKAEVPVGEALCQIDEDRASPARSWRPVPIKSRPRRSTAAKSAARRAPAGNAVSKKR